MVKSHIPGANILATIDVLVGQTNNAIFNKSKICLKRGRPIGANDKTLLKRKVQIKEIGAPEEIVPKKRVIRVIDSFKLSIQNSPKIESPEEESPKEKYLEEENVP